MRHLGWQTSVRSSSFDKNRHCPTSAGSEATNRLGAADRLQSVVRRPSKSFIDRIEDRKERACYACIMASSIESIHPLFQGGEAPARNVRRWLPPFPRIPDPSRLASPSRLECLAIATVWLGSIVMDAGVTRLSIKPVELVLAAERGILGLLVCYLFIPRFLKTGRYLAFLLASAASMLIFGAVEIYGISPVFHAQEAVPNYRCYLFLSLPAVATMAVVKLSWLFLEQQKEAAIIGQQRSEAELRFLRAQMNPHLLLNSLNNVYSYALERSERAPEMILKLAGVLRYMLYEAGDEVVPLRRELAYIRDYFELQRLAVEGRGKVKLGIKGDPAHLVIAPLVLVVFVENCFKHAVDTIEPVFVNVSIQVDADVLTIETENNLPDGSPSSHGMGRSGGIGLENVRRRLELLYPGRFQLDSGDVNGRFRAKLRLALGEA